MTDAREKYHEARLEMVRRQIEDRGVRDKAVLAAMRSVPRHEFVPENNRDDAYADGPLAIGEGQTISQPYVVASMTEHLMLSHQSEVLEIGTGCGYQTAVLAEIARHVYTIEIVPTLQDKARDTLSKLHYSNIDFHLGDGNLGWPGDRLFDAVIVTAAAPEVPPLMIDQLRVGGLMVLPVETGYGAQELIQVTRTPRGFDRRTLYSVRFVPLVSGSPNSYS